MTPIKLSMTTAEASSLLLRKAFEPSYWAYFVPMMEAMIAKAEKENKEIVITFE